MDFEKIEQSAGKLIRMNFVNNPPVDVENLARSQDFIIVSEDLKEEASGFLIIENGNKIIGIDTSEGDKRNRFTIAHEMGHYYLHHMISGTHIDEKNFYNRSKYSNREETEANVFAAALLMPKEILHRYIEMNFGMSMNEDDIDKTADDFNVSSIAMSFRLKNLGIL